MRYWGGERTVTDAKKRRIPDAERSRGAGRSTSADSRSALSGSAGGAGRAAAEPRRLSASRAPAAATRSFTGGRSTGSSNSIASGGSLKKYPFLRRFYRHQAVIGDRVTRFFLLLVLAGLVYAFVLGENGAIRIAMLRAERADLDQNIALLERNSEMLRSEIDRLEKDFDYIEKIGRERYGYVKRGEKVYKLVPGKEKD